MRAASGLRYKRLGKHERRQLLRSAAPGGPSQPVIPPGPSQAAQTATRRAIASLVAAGLLRLAPAPVRITEAENKKLLATLRRKYAVMRYARRTALGEEVVQAYRAELKTGGRIRWPARLDQVTQATLRWCPDR